MMRQVIALVDEYQSRENAKHVLLAMKENARKGFYNGSRLPLGFALEEVEKLGHLVTRHVAERVRVPERLEALLKSVVDRRVKGDAEVQARIDELSREKTRAEDKLRRLYQLVANGITEPDEMVKEQIAKLKAERERAHLALERIDNQGAPQAGLIRTSSPASGSSCDQTSPEARHRSAKPLCGR